MELLWTGFALASRGSWVRPCDGQHVGAEDRKVPGSSQDYNSPIMIK